MTYPKPAAGPRVLFPAVWPAGALSAGALSAGLFAVLLFLLPPPLSAHINDEVAVRSRLIFNRASVQLNVYLDIGVMLGSFFMNHLDPDRNGEYAEQDIESFSRFFLQHVVLEVDGRPASAELSGFDFVLFEASKANFGSIYLQYSIPLPDNTESTSSLRYLNSFEEDIATYTLNLKVGEGQNIRILSEERNEFLQDEVFVTFDFSSEPLPPVLSAESAEPAAKAEVLSKADIVPGQSKNIDRFLSTLQTRSYNPLLLLLMAAAIGFLHAFTPGHGKSLVGAYLVANQGTLLQAVGLGVIVTITHTASIYIFGALALGATYLFLPSRVIPLMTFLTGFMVAGIGLLTFIRRLSGAETDHAHILPNLRILKKQQINIIVDSSASDSCEYLLIESENDDVQTLLQAAGAEGINICSPGCEAHKRVPAKVIERQSRNLLKLAVSTGAVDGVLSRRNSPGQWEKPGNPRIAWQPGLSSLQEVNLFLRETVSHFRNRGDIQIPEEKLSWKKLLPLGIIGGIVPCPDALGILMVSIYIGQVVLGLAVVLVFSGGLALALMLIGAAIVLSGNMLSKTRKWQLVSDYVPYLSALFLIVLGIYVVIQNWIF